MGIGKDIMDDGYAMYGMGKDADALYRLEQERNEQENKTMTDKPPSSFLPTPGPWRVVKRQGDFGRRTWAIQADADKPGPDGSTIGIEPFPLAEMSMSSDSERNGYAEEDLANAVMMAAAPAMFHALSNLVVKIECVLEDFDTIDEPEECLSAAMHQLHGFIGDDLKCAAIAARRVMKKATSLEPYAMSAQERIEFVLQQHGHDDLCDPFACAKIAAEIKRALGGE